MTLGSPAICKSLHYFFRESIGLKAFATFLRPRARRPRQKSSLLSPDYKAVSRRPAPLRSAEAVPPNRGGRSGRTLARARSIWMFSQRWRSGISPDLGLPQAQRALREGRGSSRAVCAARIRGTFLQYRMAGLLFFLLAASAGLVAGSADNSIEKFARWRAPAGGCFATGKGQHSDLARGHRHSRESQLRRSLRDVSGCEWDADRECDGDDEGRADVLRPAQYRPAGDHQTDVRSVNRSWANRVGIRQQLGPESSPCAQLSGRLFGRL